MMHCSRHHIHLYLYYFFFAFSPIHCMEEQRPQALEQSTRDLLLIKPLIPRSPKPPPSPVSPNKQKPPPSLKQYGRKLTQFIAKQLLIDPKDSVDEDSSLKFSESDINPDKISLEPQNPPPLITREERTQLIAQCQQLLDEKNFSDYQKTVQEFFNALKQQQSVDQISVLVKLMQANPNTDVHILKDLIEQLTETYNLYLKNRDRTGKIRKRLETFFSYFKISASTTCREELERLSLGNSLLKPEASAEIDVTPLKSPHPSRLNASHVKNSVYDWDRKKTIPIPANMTCFSQTRQNTLKIGTSTPSIVTVNTNNNSSVVSKKMRGIPYIIIPRNNLVKGEKKSHVHLIILEQHNDTRLPICLVAFKKIFVGKSTGKIVCHNFDNEEEEGEEAIKLYSHNKPITGLVALLHQKFKYDHHKHGRCIANHVLVSSSEDNTLKLWNPYEGTPIQTMNIPEGKKIKKLIKLTESEILVSLSVNNDIDTWILNTAQPCNPPKNTNETKPYFDGAKDRTHYKIEPSSSLHIENPVHCILGTRTHVMLGRDGRIDILDPIKKTFLHSLNFDSLPIIGLAFTRFNTLAVTQEHEKGKFLTLIPQNKRTKKEKVKVT